MNITLTNEEMADKLIELEKELFLNSKTVPLTRILGTLILAAHVLTAEKRVVVEGFRAPTFEETLENMAEKYGITVEELSDLLTQFEETEKSLSQKITDGDITDFEIHLSSGSIEKDRQTIAELVKENSTHD